MADGFCELSGAEIVQAYFASQTRALVERRQDVINDTPDAVHKSRVATRRLRSLLRTFRNILDAPATEPIRAELRWWADMLGAPRDAEVLRDRLITAIQELPADMRRGPVLARITNDLTVAHARAHAQVVAEIDSARAQELVAQLEAFSQHLPVRETAERSGHDVLLPLVEKACVKVDKTAEAAIRAHGLLRLTLWHDTRKAAKAARYAADAMVTTFGDPAKKLGDAYADVTEALGELQDSIVASERLVELAQVADAAGESTVTYWTLIAMEREHAASCEGQGKKALDAVKKSGTRSWLIASQKD